MTDERDIERLVARARDLEDRRMRLARDASESEELLDFSKAMLLLHDAEAVDDLPTPIKVHIAMEFARLMPEEQFIAERGEFERLSAEFLRDFPVRGFVH